MSAYQIRKPLIHLRKYRRFVYRYASRNYGRTSERRQKYGINNPNIRNTAPDNLGGFRTLGGPQP